MERGTVTKSQKGKKAYVERKVGECFQWNAHGQCSKGDSHVVSAMTHKPLETVAKVRDEKDDRLLLPPIRRQSRLTARDKNPQRDQAIKRKAFWTRVKYHADSNSARTRHVSSGIRHVEAEGKSSKKQRKVVQEDQLQ